MKDLLMTEKKNYKETLNLPRTDFPMRANLVEREPDRLARWEENGLYRQIVDRAKERGFAEFILHDGPPFANGDVHMGTALNKVLKDLVIKSKAMSGHLAPFVPGWDCHGLPIEFKVVKESRDLSPGEIRSRSEAYARRFIDIQRASFRRLGVLGDWEHPYLTLDPAYEADVIRMFARFVELDLVYQSRKPVLWSYGAQTALAEAEVEYKDKVSPAIYVRFPLTAGRLAGKSSLVIWTTTPWTLPANLGIALHPEFTYVRGMFRRADGSADDLIIAESLVESFEKATGLELADRGDAARLRGSDLAGAEARHPFLDRTAKVITGRFVTDDTGTGAVHVAPGHGADDYIAGMENDLGLLSPVDDQGRFTDEVGVPALEGKHVFEANDAIVAMLDERGALLGRHDFTHSYPHCWRSKTPIIFRAVSQFFLRIDALRGKALEEIDRVTWLPHWGRNRIFGTVESRPDWCISRQRTWGVPLPVFFHPDGSPLVERDVVLRVADLVEKHGTNIWFELDDAELAARLDLPAGVTRGRDTLDVWIDSGTSHVAVLDRHPELHAPADLYLEATDQHRGWFQSSLMLSVAHRGTAPYRTVMTHGFVVDKDSGKKVSKSDSSRAKPMDAEYFVSKFGADILRLWVGSVDWRDEVPFHEQLFEQTGESYRRFRNTFRILLGNLFDFDPDQHAVAAENLTLIDRWILERLRDVTAECLEAYDQFEFRRVFHALNQFCAVDLSALYVDIAKDRLYCDPAGSPRRRSTQTAMQLVFDQLCRLSAPMLSFTADEAWEFAGHSESIHLEQFEPPDPRFAEKSAAPKIDALIRLRDAAQVAIEAATKSGALRKREEAALTVTAAPDDPAAVQAAADPDTALEFLMVAELDLAADPGATGLSAAARRTDHSQCPRCRRSVPDIGADDAFPDLCVRCAGAEAVAARPAKSL